MTPSPDIDSDALVRRYMEVVKVDGYVKVTAINVTAGIFDDDAPGYLASFAGDDERGHRVGRHVRMTRTEATLLRDQLTKALDAMTGRD